MIVYAVDPGTSQSAIVVYDSTQRIVLYHAIEPNEAVLRMLSTAIYVGAVLVVEKIEGMGLAVGAETFETVWYSGRFHQAWQGRAERLTRRAVKLHLCGSMKAKDPNIRQALLDKFGGKDAAIGKIKNKGPLYGLSSHCWAAFAVAVTWAETQ